MKKKNLVVGAYGYGNMGDEAILQGILDKWKRENTTVISTTPNETKQLHKVNSILLRKLDYKNYHTVIIGGGSYTPLDYDKWMSFGLKLKDKGLNLIVYAIGLTNELAGVDNFSRNQPLRKNKNILTDLIKKADYFSVRTNKDRERVKKYTKTNKYIKIDECPATNISFSREKGKKILESFGFDTNKKLCGVSLSKFGYRTGIAKLINKYKKKYDQIVPIPMCRHYYAGFENDVWLLTEYFKKINLLNSKFNNILHYSFNPSELKSVLSNLSFLLTSRKHAMILAASTGLESDNIRLLGTSESGLGEHFKVNEIDWRQFRRNKPSTEYRLKTKLIDFKGLAHYHLREKKR
jgi:polysaccharide pyruvyl transferase WcaK-like protein